MLSAGWSGVNRNPRDQTQGFHVCEGSTIRAESTGSPNHRPHQEDHMAVTVDRPADTTAIRPFTIEIPQADLDDLRTRLAATRWPEKEPVDDLSQGVPLALVQKVARYCTTSTTGASARRASTHTRSSSPRSTTSTSTS